MVYWLGVNDGRGDGFAFLDREDGRRNARSCSRGEVTMISVWQTRMWRDGYVFGLGRAMRDGF